MRFPRHCQFCLEGLFPTQGWNSGLLQWQVGSSPLVPSGKLPAAAAKSLQSCPTLCYPIDSSPPGSPIPGILQARTLEWVAISFSNAWKGKVKVKSLSRVWLLATPWTAAHQGPPSMVFSRQEYWSGVKPTTVYKIDNNENWLYYTGNSIQWSVVTYGEGNGTPLQYFCLENPMDGGAW